MIMAEKRRCSIVRLCFSCMFIGPEMGFLRILSLWPKKRRSSIVRLSSSCMFIGHEIGFLRILC